MLPAPPSSLFGPPAAFGFRVEVWKGSSGGPEGTARRGICTRQRSAAREPSELIPGANLEQWEPRGLLRGFGGEERCRPVPRRERARRDAQRPGVRTRAPTLSSRLPVGWSL